MRFSTPMLFLVLAACGTTSTSAAPGAPAPIDDAGADAPVTPPCDAFPATAFAIDGAGPGSQIHAIGAARGDRVFVAYNRPKATGKTFDVYLAALSCDGTPAFEPVRVSEDNDNDVDPSIAVQGDSVLVAWAFAWTPDRP